ncbi:MAG: type I restriction enzyme HsdR N-terminal domain-containing protein [Candidatus Poribacteria bacterium]|nr:type I restriction enzyme HsdR N-terminal domain-containing protein [Candidatus Poribacteria bacterium]
MTLEEHVDDIRKRLKEGGYISETDICNRVVVRLLKKLGWPIYDAWTVIFEYKVNKKSKRIDLALCEPQAKPVIFIEIKNFEHILRDYDKRKSIKQLAEYISHFQQDSHGYKDVSIAILTDGQKWIFFHPIREEDWKERPVCELDLIGNASKECVKILDRYLNYESIRVGKSIKAIKNDYRNEGSLLSENIVSFTRRLRVKIPDEKVEKVIDCLKAKDTFDKVIKELGISEKELTFNTNNQPNIWQIRENLIRIGRWIGRPLRIERYKNTDK